MAKDGRFLALLRGINVGGKNIIPKDDLRRCFEDLGLTSVRTYIQSGNILFRSTGSGVGELTSMIEAGLSRRFGYDAQAVVFTHRKYRAAVDAAPDTWGSSADERHYALFTLRGLTSKGMLAQVASADPDFERVHAAPGVVYWSVLRARQGRSSLAKLASKPAYQKLTIRNHNTVFKLLELFEEF